MLIPLLAWVRADKVANVEALGEINKLHNRNALLEGKIAEYKATLANLAPRPALEDLAGLDESVEIKGNYLDRYTRRKEPWSTETTWRKIFGCVSPYLLNHPSDEEVKRVLVSALFKRSSATGDSVALDDQLFRTVGIQLQALRLIKLECLDTTAGGMGMLWRLTEAGERLMVEVRSVRTKQPSQ